MRRRDLANIGLENANRLPPDFVSIPPCHISDAVGLARVTRFLLSGDVGVSSSLSGW